MSQAYINYFHVVINIHERLMQLISDSLPPTLHYRFCEQKTDCALIKNVHNVIDNSFISQIGKFHGQILHTPTFSLAYSVYILI
jgi:hypothetical protein